MPIEQVSIRFLILDAYDYYTSQQLPKVVTIKNKFQRSHRSPIDVYLVIKRWEENIKNWTQLDDICQSGVETLRYRPPPSTFFGRRVKAS